MARTSSSDLHLDELSQPEKLARLTELARARGYLSVRQAAEFFSHHYLTVLSWVDKGHLRSIPVGNRKAILLEEIERFKREGSYLKAHPEGEDGVPAPSQPSYAPALPATPAFVPPSLPSPPPPIRMDTRDDDPLPNYHDY